MTVKTVWLVFALLALLTLLVIAIIANIQLKKSKRNEQLGGPEISSKNNLKGFGRNFWKNFLEMAVIPLTVELIAAILGTLLIPHSSIFVNNIYTTVSVSSTEPTAEPSAPVAIVEPSVTPSITPTTEPATEPTPEPTHERIPEYVEVTPSVSLPTYVPITPEAPLDPNEAVFAAISAIDDNAFFSIGTTDNGKSNTWLNEGECSGLSFSVPESGSYRVTFDYPSAANMHAFLKDKTAKSTLLLDSYSFLLNMEANHEYVAGILAMSPSAGGESLVQIEPLSHEEQFISQHESNIQIIYDGRSDYSPTYTDTVTQTGVYFFSLRPEDTTDVVVTTPNGCYSFRHGFSIGLSEGDNYELEINSYGISDCEVAVFLVIDPITSSPSWW